MLILRTHIYRNHISIHETKCEDKIGVMGISVASAILTSLCLDTMALHTCTSTFHKLKLSHVVQAPINQLLEPKLDFETLVTE